jgi:hypothetical protein
MLQFNLHASVFCFAHYVSHYVCDAAYARLFVPCAPIIVLFKPGTTKKPYELALDCQFQSIFVCRERYCTQGRCLQV